MLAPALPQPEAIPRDDRSLARILGRAMADPGRAAHHAIARLRGHWYRLKYRALGVRFRAGRRFYVFGRLDVRGPGEVIFGDNVGVLAHARPYTHSREARITIGNNVLIGETQFGCVQEIVVGDGCRLAMAYIMDSDLHSSDVHGRNDPAAALSAAPVRLGENVWVAHFAGILPGTVIGRNSVVSFGSVCRSREYPENVVLVGNPARVSAPVRGAPTPEAPSAPTGP